MKKILPYKKKTILYLLLSLLCLPAMAQVTFTTEQYLADFDFAVKELETNYAGYPAIAEDPKQKNAFEQLKSSLRRQVAEDGRDGLDAIGELYAWFGDFHLRVGISTTPYMRKVPTYESMKVYNPKATYRKITDHTFLIRFPSCMGDPTIEWVKKSIEAYLASGCENLIIDIRGNRGGSDLMYEPYRQLLYDRRGYQDGAEVRNTPAHIAEMEDIDIDFVQEIVRKMKTSKDEFVPLTTRYIEIAYDSISPLPRRAALLIDASVASSGEQMVLDLRACSDRTAIYGRDNTKGCLDLSNNREVALPHTTVGLTIPMSRSYRLPDHGVDQTGIAPDTRIPLPLPETLTDNIDEWTQWVAGELEK